MYELLGQIYKEILEIFDTDVVHMGGDEVRDSFEIHSQFEIFLNFSISKMIFLNNLFISIV